MFTLIQLLPLRQLLLQQLPAFTASFVIAETFYKFHSFALETVAFLGTWFVIDGAIRLGRRGPAAHEVVSVSGKEIQRHLARLEVEGFCIIEEVIPAAEVGVVRDGVLAAVESVAEETLAKAAAVRARGHRLSAQGVQAVPGLLNLDQSAAPWLAEPRIMAITRALFGDWVRMSNTSGLANYPGNDRAYWHADWPYNQTNAVHIPAPYPDQVMKLSSLWMLSEFSPRTGGTLVVPGSHRARNNPSGGDGMFDREQPHPSELQVSGSAGSVMVFDSRLWHCVARNLGDEPRVAMNVGYMPWWLSIEPTRQGSPDFVRMVVETEGKPNITPDLRPEVYEQLPAEVKPLVRHLVA